MQVHCAHDGLVAISELQPHPKNRNSHPPEQLDRLAAILRYQGFRYPIKVSRLSGFITSGHGRLEAARLNGWTQVPVSYQEYDSEEQEYADLTADNAIASWSELDLSGINSDLGDLGPDFDLDMLGIQNFTLDVADKLDPQCDEDETPEPPAEPTTRPGDVYRLGRHRLMCGDSTSIDAVEKLMDGKKPGMVFTDPPYRQSASQTSTGFAERKSFQKMIHSDLNDFEPTGFFSVLSLLSVPTIYAFCSKDLLSQYIGYFETEGRSWDLLVMNKNNPIPMKNNKFLGDIEWLFFSRGDGAVFNGDQPYENYFKCRAVNCKPSEFGHPTEKQIAFIEPYLLISSDSGGTVLDLFGGSGSTLIACEKTGRSCFMMELDPRYCDVIVARWEKYTGQKAELLNG